MRAGDVVFGILSILTGPLHHRLPEVGHGQPMNVGQSDDAALRAKMEPAPPFSQTREKRNTPSLASKDARSLARQLENEMAIRTTLPKRQPHFGVLKPHARRTRLCACLCPYSQLAQPIPRTPPLLICHGTLGWPIRFYDLETV